MQDRKIWGLTGDAGNNWYMGQAPIASTENFRVSRDQQDSVVTKTPFLSRSCSRGSWVVTDWVTSL